ncbi:MAG: DUF4366 domain-containing protein [Clostridia bacterium]|nr:DUF4366 domain-containing protein [Clostridia bacterium]
MRRNAKRLTAVLSLLICLGMFDMMMPDAGMLSGNAAAEEATEVGSEAATVPDNSDAEDKTETPVGTYDLTVTHDSEVSDETDNSEITDSTDEADTVESETSETTDESVSTPEPEIPDVTSEPVSPESTDEPVATPEPELPDVTDEPVLPDSTDKPIITPESEKPDTTTEPEITPVPDVPEYEYMIQIIPPLNWTNAPSADAFIRFRDQMGYGWDRIEIRASHTDWQDISEHFLTADEMDFPVYDNGSIIVRVTDPAGNHHETQAFVSCFDREAPLLTAGIVDQSLQAVALDSLSGVAGIHVNDLLFTTLDSGSLDIRLESRLNQYKKLTVYAYDHVGNISEEVMLDNPYYANVCPTKKPSSGGSGNSSTKPAATAAPTATPTPEPTATPAPEITYSPGTPFQMDGNMQTLDLLFSSNTNKQFITVQTRNGETYYLVIDYDKPIDEKSNLYETYFLNMVDDRDLMDIVSEEDMITPEPEVIYVTPEPTEIPVTEPVQSEPAQESSTGGLLALLAFAGAGGGTLWYFKFRKGDTKKQAGGAFDEYDFDDEDEPMEE